MKYSQGLFGLLSLMVMLSACMGDQSDGIRAITPLPASSDITTTESSEVASEQSTITVTPTAIAPTENLQATPTPLNNQLASGEARAIAATADAVFVPTMQGEKLVFEENPVPLAFDEFYVGYDMRRGWTMTDKLLSLDGQMVVIEGYIAPPLKPEVDFFVLTQIQLAFCPFCSTDADWPDRIALTYLPERAIFNTQYPVRVIGRLEVGSSVDAETGMVSLVRLYADEINVLD